MTREDKGHYAEKHPGFGPVPEGLAEEIRGKAKDGEITCASAFQVAASLTLPPSEVGRAVDLMGLSIVRCQLGLFGYPGRSRVVEPAEDVPEDLRSAIQASLVDGKLPCAEAWRLAEVFGMGRLPLAGAAEALRVKISRCQLGAF